MPRSSHWNRALACGVIAGLAALGAAAAPASASVPSRALKAGPIEATAGDGQILPTSVLCPPGASPLAETCAVIGTDSLAGGSQLEAVVRGTPQPVATGGDYVAGACTTSTTCLFVWSDAELLWGNEAGNDVSLETSLRDATTLAGVACVSATTCVAVGSLHRAGKPSHGVVAVVTRAERSPSAIQVPGAAVLYGVACASTTTCYAVGSTSTSKTGTALVVPIVNGHLRAREMVGSSSALHDVACGAATTCWATGTLRGTTNVVVPIRAGTPGSARRGRIADGIACVSATTCLLASGTGGHSGPNGAGFARVYELTNGVVTSQLSLDSLFGGPFRGIACPIPTECLLGAWSTTQTGGVVALSL